MLSKVISENSFFQSVFIVIAQGICVFFAWRGSIKSTFKKRTIEISKLSTIMRNLVICTVIMWLLGATINFTEIDKKIEENMKSDMKMQYKEYLMQYLYSEKELDNYYQEKEKEISKEKNKEQRHLVVLELALLMAYFIALFAQKETIASYCILDDQTIKE